MKLYLLTSLSPLCTLLLCNNIEESVDIKKCGIGNLTNDWTVEQIESTFLAVSHFSRLKQRFQLSGWRGQGDTDLFTAAVQNSRRISRREFGPK